MNIENVVNCYQLASTDRAKGKYCNDGQGGTRWVMPVSSKPGHNYLSKAKFGWLGIGYGGDCCFYNSVFDDAQHARVRRRNGRIVSVADNRHRDGTRMGMAG